MATLPPLSPPLGLTSSSSTTWPSSAPRHAVLTSPPPSSSSSSASVSTSTSYAVLPHPDISPATTITALPRPIAPPSPRQAYSFTSLRPLSSLEQPLSHYPPPPAPVHSTSLPPSRIHHRTSPTIPIQKLTSSRTRSRSITSQGSGAISAFRRTPPSSSLLLTNLRSPPLQSTSLPQYSPPVRTRSTPALFDQDHYRFDYVPRDMASPPRSSQPSPSLFPVQLGRQRDESDGDDVEDDTADAMRFEPRSKLTRRSDTGLRQRWEAAVSGERRGSNGYATPPGIVSGGGVDSLPPGTVQPVITGSLGLMGISSSTSAPPSRYERAPDSGFDVNILSTDGEEPLPTSLLRPPPPPRSILETLASTPLVLLLLRLLSVVPSMLGTFCLFARLWEGDVPTASSPAIFQKGSRLENVVACYWSILTAVECFLLTSGLTRRWTTYYSLPSTLLRLLSLQTICWPATSITLRLLGPSRPLAAWLVIGTTTSVSNAVRIWVTSNIPGGSGASLARAFGGARKTGMTNGAYNADGGGVAGVAVPVLASFGLGGGPSKVSGATPSAVRTRRRMDWGSVVRQCAWPCLAGYMLTCWSLLIERDLERRARGVAGGFGA